MSEDRHDRQQANPAYYDDISLIDLWLVLMRRKWIIAGVFLACLLDGTVYWQMQVPGQS